jgi:hypothetical protein
MPKVLSEDLREAGAIALLELAKNKYPEYSDAQLSSLFKRASSKIRKVRSKPVVETSAVQTQ